MVQVWCCCRFFVCFPPSAHPWQLFYLLAPLLTALSVCVRLQWAVRFWTWHILRRGSAVQTPTTSWQRCTKGANRSAGCRTSSHGCATRPEALPAETWPRRALSLPCSPPDTPPRAPCSAPQAPEPPLNSEPAADIKGSCATQTGLAHSC